jgi:hypothetical protein
MTKRCRPTSALLPNPTGEPVEDVAAFMTLCSSFQDVEALPDAPFSGQALSPLLLQLAIFYCSLEH